MALKPWERYGQTAAPAGDPIIAGPDPYKQANEVRANEDQEIERARLGISQASLGITQANQQRQETLLPLEQQAKQLQIQKLQQDVRSGDPVQQQAQNASSLLKAAGVDIARGIDPVSDLIKGSTSGYVQAAGANAWGALTGDATSGMENIGRLKTVASELTLQMTGGSLGAQVSNADRDFIVERVGNIADPTVPADQRLAAWEQVKARMASLSGQSPVAAASPTATQDQPVGGYDEQAGGIFGGNTDDSPAPPTAPPTPGGSERGGISDLLNQGVTLGLADEAQGLGGYISAFLTGDDPQAAYVRDRDDARRRVAEARQDNPILGTGLELLAGGGATRIAAGAGNALRSVVGQGAALGGVGGYGYGEGNPSVTNALAGAAGGAALGGALYGVGRGVGALASRRQGPSPTAEQLALVQAGERQGVPMRQPDVRPELRNQMADAETSVTAGPIIRDARAQDVARIEQRVGEIGGSGAVAEPYQLGQTVQGAGTRYIARTRQQASRLYDRARAEANGATVQPTEAVAAIDNNIAELRAAGENSNAGQIAYLEGLKADLNRPLTIEAVQNLRTNMRGQLSEKGLTGTDAERRVGQVIDAANADLVRELPQGASQALRSADTFYRERQTFINDTLKQFMGNRGNPLPAETAAQRLISMTKGERGNQSRFASMWKELEPDEQADIAATVAESLGRKRNGEFSAATLVGSLDPRKGINPRTARLIFGDEGAEALNDLRQIARAKSDTQAALNNSRTGTAINAASGGLKNMMLGAFGLSQGGIGGAVALPIAGRMIASLGEKRAARMLLNPDFTKWLKNAPNSSNPRVIDRYFSRLAGMNSIAANDNQAFQAALREAAQQSPGRLAAQEENDRRPEPPQ